MVVLSVLSNSVQPAAVWRDAVITQRIHRTCKQRRYCKRQQAPGKRVVDTTTWTKYNL